MTSSLANLNDKQHAMAVAIADVYDSTNHGLKIVPAAATNGATAARDVSLSPLTDSTHAAGGGAGSATFTLAAALTYRMRLDPDFSAGAAAGSFVAGVYKLGGAPSGDADGWVIQGGEEHEISCAAGGTLHVRGMASSSGLSAGRWKCVRKF